MDKWLANLSNTQILFAAIVIGGLLLFIGGGVVKVKELRIVFWVFLVFGILYLLFRASKGMH